MVARYVSLFFSLFLLSQPPVDALCFLLPHSYLRPDIYLPRVSVDDPSAGGERKRERASERAFVAKRTERDNGNALARSLAAIEIELHFLANEARYTTALVTLANNGAMLRRTPARPITATISFSTLHQRTGGAGFLAL